MFIDMNDFRLFRWHNVGEITLFLYGTNNNFSKSLFFINFVILMEKKNLLMKTEQ